jgi:hypothetical protein
MIHSNSLHALNQNRQLRRTAGMQPRIIDVICTASRLVQERLLGIASGARHRSISMLRARVFWGTPSFFQFERQGPVQQRLGPGLTRESGSFWTISRW